MTRVAAVLLALILTGCQGLPARHEADPPPSAPPLPTPDDKSALYE